VTVQRLARGLQVVVLLLAAAALLDWLDQVWRRRAPGAARG
jgi:hypothetical protein